MAGDEFIDDWPEQRENIIDDTLNEIRDQRDDAQESHLYGTYDFNPQTFQGATHLVIGPVTFETAYNSAPVITYGEQPTGINLSDTADVSATRYAPFLVKAYTYAFRTTRGVVDGFYIGLYALTTPVPGITKHTIHWTADGKASVYKDTNTEESWTQEYDQSQPDYLFEDAGDGYDETDVSVDDGTGA